MEPPFLEKSLADLRPLAADFSFSPLLSLAKIPALSRASRLKRNLSPLKK
jgi:hypothetical protein